MKDYLTRFIASESGAVTVDWVVLTAAMATFGLGVASIITTAAQDPADGLGARLEQFDID